MGDAYTSTPDCRMTLADVLAVLDLADEAGAHLWIDGGWAVDAVLGEVTRPHGDLDVALEDRHAQAFEAALVAEGFERQPPDSDLPTVFVMRHPDRRAVDLHVITFDPEGNGVLGSGVGLCYPAASLRGRGVLGGREVDCIRPDWQVEFRSRYEPDAEDWADVSALCTRFELAIPDNYRRFRRG